MYECVTIKLRLETRMKDYAKGERKRSALQKKKTEKNKLKKKENEN